MPAVIEFSETVNQSTTPRATATLYDVETPAVAIAKASIVTLTLTVTDRSASYVRTAQDILDTNGGTVATDGVVTIKLTTADTATVGNCVCVLGWTWTDNEAVTQTGSQIFVFEVVSTQ